MWHSIRHNIPIWPAFDTMVLYMSFNFSSFHQETSKALEHISQDIGQLRTGKANVQLLDSVKVEAYGSWLKINEVANISVPDANMILVSPWDKSLLGAVEKAINSAALNLNAVVDSQVIRIVVPSLTEERRKEMVKMLHQKIEGGRVMLRSIRTDAKKEVDGQKGQPGISEDMIEDDLSQLEVLVKGYMDKLDDLAVRKEKELLTI